MLKKILALLAMLYAAASFAAVDVNKATPAELDGIKGIGPAISAKILDERKKGNFKDWDDLITRVQGVGETNAAKFSAEGLTVNGAGFKGAAAAPRKDTKAATKADDKKTDAKPAGASSSENKKEAKAEAKAKKDAEKKAKTEKKAAKADATTSAASAAKK